MHQHNRSGRRHRRLAGGQHCLRAIHLPGRKIAVELNRKTLRQPLARKLHRRQQPVLAPLAARAQHAWRWPRPAPTRSAARSPRCRSRRADRINRGIRSNPAGLVPAALVPPSQSRHMKPQTPAAGAPGSAARILPRISSRRRLVPFARGCSLLSCNGRQRRRAPSTSRESSAWGTARRSRNRVHPPAIPGRFFNCPSCSKQPLPHPAPAAAPPH